jgi:SAM-dependent methyltransferase
MYKWKRKVPMPAMDYAQVAELYDVYVQTEMDVPFFIEEAQGCRSVLELTSGTGRLSLPLLRAGVRLDCLDSSPEMLAVLRRKLAVQGLAAAVFEKDLCSFSLPERYELILVPFNAFAEVVEPEAQRAALATMHAHLAQAGRLIVTLHNPAVRMQGMDGQVHLRGQFPLPERGGTLFLSAMERFDPATRLVSGAQFYELYSVDGVMRSKRFTTLRFFLHSPETFKALAQTQGFRVAAVYGDYSRAAFDQASSPFMIWVLERN